MDPNVQALFAQLKNVFPMGDVECRFENELHKLRLERDGPSQWLNVAREFLDDHTVPELLASFARWQIPETFRNSTHNLWLYLSEADIREVNDEFGHGR